MLPVESVSLTLGRERGNIEYTKATDVRMENIQTMVNLDFEVYYDEETPLLCGDMERLE